MSGLPLDKCLQRLDLDLRELLAPTDRLAQPGHLEVRVGRLARRQRWVQSRQVLRLTQKASGSGKLTRFNRPDAHRLISISQENQVIAFAKVNSSLSDKESFREGQI